MVALLATSLSAQDPALQDQPPPDQPETGWRKFGSRPADAGPPPLGNLTIPAGTWIKIRVDEPVSSDRNQQGDVFTATLAAPLVADGIVVARRGQSVAGVVAEAQKAGHIKGTSRLALELTEITLADGRQVTVRTRLTGRSGDTSVGRDAAAIATATGTGAFIGAAADGGFGAGMGAIAGAGAAAIGVLATRGRATEVYPESVLTFRIEEPVTVRADSAEHAFQPVRQSDYDDRAVSRTPPQRRAGFYGAYPPYWGPGVWGPGVWGPSVWIYSGRGWGRPYYYRRYGRRW
jgi:hypothetical protein